MFFSSRTPKDLTANRLAMAQESSKRPLLDLTLSNPTLVDLGYPLDLLEGLSDPAGLRYEPEPFGSLTARESLAEYLGTKGLKVEPSRILLTSGTSEAFSYVFKLLGDPGDKILVPVPGYPLLEHLAALEGLGTIPYRHRVEEGWPLERDSFPQELPLGVRGIAAVSPQNPTGCSLSVPDLDFLQAKCRKADVAFLLDEVFSNFGNDSLPGIDPGVLSFRFGGLSKSLGLPQLKLSWTIVNGPARILEETRKRLEFIADSYLSVSTPVQVALPTLLRWAPKLQILVQERLEHNRKSLERVFTGVSGVKIWGSQGGWQGLLEIVGSDRQDEDWAEELIKKKGVLVHPGMFYDFPKGTFLVLNLLPTPAVFQEGIEAIRDLVMRGA